MENPFQSITKVWLEKIRLALDYKKKHFQDTADEGMKFFSGPYTFMYGIKERKGAADFLYTGDDDMPLPSFCMTVNKVAEMVQLFGPVLYHRNPVRQVNPRKIPMVPITLFGDPNDPMVQQYYMQLQMQTQQTRGLDDARAELLSFYLNYTPTALNLKEESRAVIDESLIKGMGVWWHEIYRPRGAQFKMVGSFYDTVDDLVIDPDNETIEAATWIARRCCHPVWMVEQEYGYPPGSLKGNMESLGQMGTITATKNDYDRKRGLTNDLLVYYKIYSKMGMGGRLQGIVPEARDLDVFGDNCFLVICDTMDYPLNLPEPIWQNPDAIQQAVQWETPYWADDAWPCTTLSFHKVPRCVWPMSHLKPGMGELKFINWAYSFLAGKIKTACRDFIAVAKSAAEEIKKTIVSGTDYELMEIEKQHGTISEVVQFLQHPPFHGDIFRVIQAVEDNFEKRVGLTELMYGQTATQLRSASEANVKADQLRVRPDDMANKVEDAMTEAARKEAFAARWHLDPMDVQPVMGNIGAQYWAQLVTPSDPTEILHQLEYRIEAGSAKKPNKDKQASDANQAVQTLFQPLWQLATMGQVGPINALLAFWGKSLDIDVTPFMIQPPQPMVPQQPEGQAGPQGGQA